MSASLTLPIATPARSSLTVVREQLAEATSARKCHTCGCFGATVDALAKSSVAAQLAAELDRARSVIAPAKYDCLGCAVCFPAVAANAFAEEHPTEAGGLDLCPTEAPEAREGWPALAGDYRVVRYHAPVAVCALNSPSIVEALARRAPEGLSIVGTMHTENLGIERLIENVLDNPNIRFVVVCGDDTQQAVGHLPGQSIVALAANGIDDAGRIVGARGRRPVLKNVAPADVEAFRARVEIVDAIGETRPERLLEILSDCAARDPGPAPSYTRGACVQHVETTSPKRLVRDPAGFFVVHPERRRARIVVEHFTNAGVLDVVLEGTAPADLYAEIVARELLTRLDHAAYLGRELARAENALRTGEPYVQDRAAGEEEPVVVPASCGCGTRCGE
jgi:tetrahydromethanopterin S-methyltransferase subunit A